MFRLRERDPAWLSSEGSGSSLFKSDTSASRAQSTSTAKHEGTLRKIAHRGTEIFVAVGSELRWSELGLLRDAGEGTGAERAYRILKTPVARPITQLTVSPSGNYIAILTSHTCHVCMLPPTPHLRSRERSPLRLKAFQIGPTAHVLEQAPLVSAIWHPLSPSGDCLVTITHDACVRMWELDSDNRSSFDEPSLAVDLKKLANATSAQADFSASKYGTNKGFSPDDVEMQVAAACFGGQGGEDEHGWASMTLWIAMTEGDIYALCPFLPARWRAPASLLPSLSTSVVQRSKALARDADATESERAAVDQQYRWLTEVDAQESIAFSAEDDFDTSEVYARPARLSPVPKLQGPFQISPAPDFGEITDIYVIASRTDEDALYDEADQQDDAEEGLSAGIVCLATSTNEIHVCLDVEGVEAEWLPSKRSRAYTFDDVDDSRELILLDTIDLASSDEDDNGWPTFTSSPHHRYELFVTHPAGVCGLSFLPWITSLQDELASPSDNGAAFRFNVLLDSANTSVDRLIELPTDPDQTINAAVVMNEPGADLVVLISASDSPYAAILDVGSPPNPYAPDDVATVGALAAPEPRAPYRPAAEFEQNSALPKLIKSAQEKQLLGSDLKSQVRFSPATLQLMTEAHRIMSTETHRLGVAAADLFRRCERMRSELQEQARKIAEIAQRVDVVTGQDEDVESEMDEDGEQDQPLTGREKIEHRIEESQQKTIELNERADALRRRIARLGGQPLSAKEHAFAAEVSKLERSILSVDAAGGEPTSTDDSPPPKMKIGSLTARFDAVQNLQQELVAQAKKAEDQATSGADAKQVGGLRSSGIGGEFRKQKLVQVMGLLERETALIEAVIERLQRLQGM